MIPVPSIVGLAITASLVMSAGAGVWSYNHGVETDKARSDLVISTLKSDAKDNLAAADKRNIDLSAQLLNTKEGAEREFQIERERNEKQLASLNSGFKRMRDEIAAVARGPGTSQDSITACRSDASALGDVLDSALRAHAICSGHAEKEAGIARTVLGSWPVISTKELK